MKNKAFDGTIKGGRKDGATLMGRIGYGLGLGLVSLIGLLAGALMPSSSIAGPFGIDMGQEVKHLNPQSDENKVFVRSVPRPHPDFKEYAVWWTDETGICLIIAISKRHDNDRYGSDVRATFTKVADALDLKYGKSKRIDFLKSGALWKDLDEWVMSIRQSERFFFANWENPKPDGADDSISGIELSVTALSNDNSFLRLQYTLKNFEQCSKIIEDRANGSL